MAHTIKRGSQTPSANRKGILTRIWMRKRTIERREGENEEAMPCLVVSLLQRFYPRLDACRLRVWMVEAGERRENVGKMR